MIKFGLACDQKHSFDGWFSSSDDFDTQIKRGLVTCPVCDSATVGKTLMVPSVSTGRQQDKIAVSKLGVAQREIVKEMRRLRDKITDSSEDVGKRFPEEARKIHYGESKERAIYGEATRDDVKSLVDEGIEIAQLPFVPDKIN